MTATLCAILIQRGQLSWNSTIKDVFSDQLSTIPEKYYDVTLAQLLTHRSGLPDDRQPPQKLWDQIWNLNGPMLEQRRQLIELWLSQKRLPADEFRYANAGYDIAGAMCERVTGRTYEDLLRHELLCPIGMSSARFGAPGVTNPFCQPWGHDCYQGKWVPVPPGPFADNPAATAPSGTLNCSLIDWAKFAALHLRGEKVGDPLLPRDAFLKLHEPVGEYACGWFVGSREWANGRTLSHTGTDNHWWSAIWLAPNRNEAFLAAANAATPDADNACEEAIRKLIGVADRLDQP